MALFDLIYERLIWDSMPVLMRQPVHYAWLKALFAGVDNVGDAFNANRLLNLYRLAHNGQVCYLEAVLNDVFDNVSRRIYISDGPVKDPLFVSMIAENKPQYVYKAVEATMVAIYTDDEVAGMNAPFIINVPGAITIDANLIARMSALVDTYRLPSKKDYTIVNF